MFTIDNPYYKISGVPFDYKTCIPIDSQEFWDGFTKQLDLKRNEQISSISLVDRELHVKITVHGKNIR